MADDRLTDAVAGFLTDPGVRRDPYARLAMLQAEAPVMRSPFGGWLVTTHAAVRTVMSSADFGVDLTPSGIGADVAEQQAEDLRLLMMAFRDPPEQTRLRRLASSAFSSRSCAGHRLMVASAVDEILVSAGEDTLSDLVADVGRNLPVHVNCRMLGMPVKDHAAILRWTDSLAAHMGRLGRPDLPELREQQRQFATYITHLLDDRSEKQGILAALSRAHDTARLTHNELIAYVMLLLVSGRETVTNMISSAVLTVLRHPEHADLLRQKPHLVGPALRECLRLESPVRLVARIAQRETAIGGVDVRRGEVVMAVLAAANRDPSVFTHPHDFDIGRSAAGEVVFGAGAHYCLGAALALMEGEEILDRLFCRDRKIRPVIDLDDPPWSNSLPFRGLQSFPVWTGAA